MLVFGLESKCVTVLAFSFKSIRRMLVAGIPAYAVILGLGVTAVAV